ncbi:YfiT family bacillithiol transferase [Fibrella forsythiae]|uniref:Metal-dependent hydrolase n=1 Tax=Fibrella forsythiae TaxID=2817061 RepID=A0ABS3JD64_9BACT|nr:putative metal-dependent hydrolase [Fibrella forsythiae]MBO0947937.1 putative metal-dependent hydrolase [Fibrella forsythiae]
MQNLDLLRYPIGPMPSSQSYTPEQLAANLSSITECPRKLTELVQTWSDSRLDTPYRPDGWTVRQVVHHVADSHMNAYIRTRLALTEDNPRISPYEEQEWAKLDDSTLPVAPSLAILTNLHLRWVRCLQHLTSDQLGRTYLHPGNQQTYTVADVLALYAWHGEHHYQHIARLAQRNGWEG